MSVKIAGLMTMKIDTRLRPGDGLDKTPAIRFLANVQAGAATQEIENHGPLFW